MAAGKTSLYISEADAPLFERAKELLGEDSLSAAIAEAIRRLVVQEETKKQGFESIEIEIGTCYNGRGSDNIKKIRFTGKEIAWHKILHGQTSSGEDRGTIYTLYLTAKGKFLLVTEVFSRWQGESSTTSYEIYDSLDDIEAPAGIITKARESIGEDPVVELDV